jgi:hypothetical protein
MSSSNDPVKNSYMEQVQAKQAVLEEELRANKMPVARRARMQEAPMAAPAAAVPGQGAMAPQQQQAMQQAQPGYPDAAARYTRGFRVMPQPEPVSAAVDVRITGFWRWRTVVVPPNAYVVHTRKGAEKPLHLGLGISFPFNPYTDSFLVVPGAMQTILINAYCICKELQGLLVQGYVQWIIADFSTAYKKLDFSDSVDPMRVVNVQLREQAEAAIKDKVATMGIDEVLSDKQPIIQELTARLRAVAEGHGDSDKGLGLRIVTVQIKEAVVSSGRLWENLQKPFRAERERVARMAQLTADSEIGARELEHEKARETARLATDADLDKLRAQREAEAFDRQQAESARREQRAQEVARHIAVEQQQTHLQTERDKRELEQARVEHERLLAESRREAKHQALLKEVQLNVAESAKRAEETAAQAALEKAKLEAEAALARLRQVELLARKEAEVKAALAIEEAQSAIHNRQAEVELSHQATRQKIENDLSAGQLQARLISTLPEVADKLPKPETLRAVSIGDGAQQGAGALAQLVAQVLALVQAFRLDGATPPPTNSLPSPKPTPKG